MTGSHNAGRLSHCYRGDNIALIAIPSPMGSATQGMLTGAWLLPNTLPINGVSTRKLGQSLTCFSLSSGDHPTRPYAGGNAAPRGPCARRDAMACAHPRDSIPASGTMSSPPAPAAGEGSRWCGGDGRGPRQRPCALPRLPRSSRGDAPPHTPWPGSWHALCSLSMRRKASSCVACRQGATDETAAHMLGHPASCLSSRRPESPASRDTHAPTSSVQGGVIRPRARTRHGCGSPALSV